MDLKNLLNKEQYEAATTIDGQLLILAGAGSGKTRVLTYRIAYMLEERAIQPYNILAITFTNKAAQEMRERVKSLIGDRADSMWISTFHSSCVKILRREIEKLGYKKDFTIYDSYDQKALVKECIKQLNINDKDITEQEVISKIGKAKDNLITPTQYKRQNESDFRGNKIADLYIMYQKRLKDNNALDFDDLIFKTVELFQNNPEVLDFYQNKFKYVMIDEYQDTNRCQYEFVKLLASKHKNICVVGDDDQCIYAWRGADIRNILDFEKDYPGAKVVKLEQNYRSKANILDAANNVIKFNSNRKSKVLRTEAENGEKIRIYRAFSDNDEAQFIASEIKKFMEEKDLTYKDFAILYRTNAQSRIFEDCFIKRDIPYRIIGGLKFYDRKEIKDIMGYLKVINNPSDSISLRRIVNVPKRNIGDATVSKVMDFSNEYDDGLYNSLLDCENISTLSPRNISSIRKFTDLMENLMDMSEQIPVSMLIEYILDKSGYMKELKDSKEPEDQSRVENLKELVSAAVDFEKSNEEDKSLSAFLEKVALVQDVDNMDQNADTLVMMTVHSAKGLEFPIVFMVGMENGIFPGTASFDSESEMEESRRLCYVGITRARNVLYMTSAEVRKVFGRTVAYPQSDFIAEIPKELKDFVKGNTSAGLSTRSSMMASPSYGGRDFNRNPHSLRSDYNNNYSSNRGSSKETMLDAARKLKETLDSSSGGMLTKNEATMGRKIRHPKFGIGTIIKTINEGDDLKLTIAFDSQGIKTLLLSFAPLELL
ncbi:DNA helicase PcrA [Clostridium folliculivorans]|uniref:ATP-dependent DNA helicase n=1 Tax=Clostridium folliculivorans TaxID=2886038 RepID=A0A9W5Y490_9CLOT|nr:DNA helicase PcrA [Clostridium folliculivorans]GKU26454.1 DNA helicase [Clostridium folliculivorans]GKU31991.1 DNA helicase [Clostridium folliculivorans]